MGTAELTEKIEELARKHGYECIGHTTTDNIRVRKEARDMCEANVCGKFGTNWACPPGCGEFEDFERRIKAAEGVVVFQTIMELEDEFDFETMMEAGELHVSRTPEFAADVRELAPDCLVMSAGACQICPKCTYPDEPCRFPDKRFTPMESCLVVADVCTQAGIPYNHGSDHIAFVSCVIF